MTSENVTEYEAVESAAARKSTLADWPVGLRSSRACLQAVDVGSVRAHRASDSSPGYDLR
ncbi:hypothetical protein [Streptomyces sp. NPDC002520]